MQAGILMIVYVLSVISVQFVGFLISRLIEYQWPTLGLTAFLLLFMAAFGIAWPLAVLVAEWVIRRLGHVVETAQSGDALRDMGRRRTEKVSATT
jgi:ABC-type multidrug transport system fused ATPase/permease subunit